jgi:hypothetical protein
MNIITNERLVRRNARIAQVSMLAGLLVLAGGMYISFRVPEQFGLSLVALLVGFTLSQIGIYFSNRWGRKPRPDELLDQALKGLDSHYTIFHYTGPASHLLVGPAGIWVLQPYHQRGTITYSKGRWRQKGGNIYMKIFAQEGIGRPDVEVSAEVQSVQRFLQEYFPDDDKIPPVEAALVFTNPKVEINIPEDESPPAETLPVAKLKSEIRKKAKDKYLSPERADQIAAKIAA